MTILRHELRQGIKATLAWAIGCTAVVLLGMSVFPRVKSNAVLFEKMLDSMGAMAKAFAMDKLDYGKVLGFYAAEAGNTLALGGGMFAGILGSAMLAKEEGRHTAEYLFAHPVSRTWVLLQKFCAMVLQMVLFLVIAAGASLLAFRLLGEPVDMRDFAEIYLGLFLLMLQLACICWGISAFLSRESLGLGLGLSLMLYFVKLLINMEVGIAELKYITPYYYTEAVRLVGAQSFSPQLLRLGLVVSGTFFLLGMVRYLRKDLRI